MTEKTYFAVIGDIISSKKATDRNQLQERLNDVLNDINKTYAKDIASKFVITLGDEFQGLLIKAERLLEITDRIKFLMEPVEIRFGIGIGNIETKINKESSVGADGPAFWNARKAINIIHDHNDYKRSKIMIQAGLNEEDENENEFLNVVNESLHLCDYMESKWRKTQKNVIKESILHFGYDTKITQKELSVLLNLSVQSVNFKIKNTGYYNYLRTKKSICEALQEMWGNDKRNGKENKKIK
ncbi:SatD family protein [Methanolapillus ohkumae]|uniref:DNA-binding protein n=1 Tax=Methanolapillus ohkumae TaxID=3028298 RepID=A0AA96VIQ2_9EURY|nr:hypothetical protein MsAm2_10040 [Methanosarcinaceae archaeon Am2]